LGLRLRPWAVLERKIAQFSQSRARASQMPLALFFRATHSVAAMRVCNPDCSPLESKA